MQDWITISWLSLLIVLIIGIAEGIRRFAGWPSEFTRKFVHITVGIISVVTVALLQSALPMILIAGSFGLINLLALRNGFLKSMHGARPSYGTAYFPLAFSVLLILAFPTHKLIIIAAMLVLTFGDAAAAIVGESIGKPGEYVLIRDPKSWHGSLAMLLVTTATLFFLLKYDLFSLGYSYTSFESFWYALATALVATAAEALSHKGSDNLSVPFATAIILYFFIEHSQTENIQLTQAILYAFIAAAISLKLRFLAPSGAVALFLLAVPIF
ncbi:MAG: hypothetical protein AAFP70_11080, partial [Calditrichota bacterium]